MWSQLRRSLLSWFLAMAMFCMAFPVEAITLQTYDTMERQQVSTASNHSIRLKTGSGVDASTDTIVLHFPSGFSLASLVASDVLLTHGPMGTETVEIMAALPAVGVWGVSISGQNITLTAPTDAAPGEINAGHNVFIRIGTNAGGAHRIVNPAGVGSYTITINGTFGDSGGITVPIVNGDTAVVSLTIAGAGGGGGGSGGGGGGPSDVTPPVISNVQAVNITLNSADISWNTDENADSLVDYGFTPIYGSTVSDALSFVTSHSLHLSGLTQGTTYHFRVQSKDAQNNSAISSDVTFQTLSPSAAPVISNVHVTNITQTTALVLWDTDIPASSVVDYGLTPAYGLSANTPGLTLNHSVSLVGLPMDSLIHFRVTSVEAGGLSSQSGDQNFLTLGDTTPPANALNFTATPGDAQVSLGWVNPMDPDFSFVRILARTDAPPTGPNDGRVVYQGAGTNVIDSGLTNGTHYFYAIFAFDGSNNASSGAWADATPAGVPLPPPPVPPVPPVPPSPPPVTPPVIVPPPPSTGGPAPTPPPVTPPVIPPVVPPEPTLPPSPVTVPVPPEVIPQPVPTPGGAILTIHPRFFVPNSTLELAEDETGKIGVVAGRTLLVRVSGFEQGSLPKQGSIQVGTSLYQLTTTANGDAWAATFIPGLQSGDVRVITRLEFTNGAVATNEQTLAVQSAGRIYEKTPSKGEAPLSEAIVSLEAWNGSAYIPWDGHALGQASSQKTGKEGNFSFYVTNGKYRVTVKKEDYTDVTQELTVRRNVVASDLLITKVSKPIAEVIVPGASVGQNVRAVVDEIGNRIQSVRTPEAQKAAEQVVAPAVVLVAIANTATALSAISLLNYLYFLVTQPILLLGRRKRQKFGVVYNALTKKEVDLAIVRLVEAKSGRVIQTRITDAKGRFAFTATPGSYRLQVVKQGFVFPTQYLKQEKLDVDYVDLYHGELIDVKETAVLTVNIPIDPVEKVETPRDVRVKKILRKTQNIVGLGSVLISVVALFFSPTALMAGMLVFQVLMYLLFRRLSLPPKPKNFGIVYDTTTRKPLGHAIVRIFDKKYNKLLETQITDGKGKYGFIVGRNVYYLLGQSPGYTAYKSPDIDLTQKADTVIDTPIALSPEVKGKK